MTQEGGREDRRDMEYLTMKFQRKSCEEGENTFDTPFISTVFQLGIARSRYLILSLSWSWEVNANGRLYVCIRRLKRCPGK